MYFKFHEDMRKIFNEDIDKHNILSWIIYNTNYQEEYNGLKIYQCYISSSTISKCTGIQLTKTKRLLKTLEEERFISYIHKSKSKYTSSIIYSDFIAKNSQKSEPVDEPVSEPVSEPVQIVGNTKTQTLSEPVDEPVSEPVSEPLSINISRNISNIYSRVITQLNKKANKKFKATTKKTIACINARLNEGFLEDDFYKVIEIKSKTWLHDPEMNRYLRPETLFGNKFESYLNENYEPKENNVVPFKGKEL